MDDCKTDAAAAGTSDANCEIDARQDKTSKVCELILYQSLTHTQSEAGEPGVTITDGAGNTIDWRTHGEKVTNGHDEDGHENGYSAQDPDGNLVHYPANPINAIPNRYENYSGHIQHDQLAEITGDHDQWDYGGRANPDTSVKVTCCHYDGKALDDYTTADNWGSDDDDNNWLPKGNRATGERRRKRFCPPDERWYADQGPYIEYVQEGNSVEVDTQAKIDALKEGDFVCFKNRTVVSQVLMASIDDYDLPAGHALEGSYTGINNKTTGILYKEEEVWEQDKSDTSFYQVRATHLPANRTVPT